MQMQIVEYVRARQTPPLKFKIRPGTSDIKAVEEVFKNNSYQRKKFKLEYGDRWIDMGANVGAFSVMASSICGRPVVSYEADATNRDIATDNIIMNGFAADVQRAAIMPQDYIPNTVDFYVSSRPMALRRHSIYEPKKDFTIITCPVIRFGEAMGYGRVRGADCLKMNIEGVEIPILRSPDFGYAIVGVRKLVLEWSFDKEPSMAVLRETLDKLRQFFSYVDVNKKIDIPDANWPFYPPNLFIYAMR